MNIAITGAGGFLGQRLAKLLLADARVSRLVLCDVGPIAAQGNDSRVVTRVGDLSEAPAAAGAIEGADLVFHLAAVVSGQAEADFDLGMRVNLDGTRSLLDAARRGGRRPRFVLASSLAVFGPPLPAVVTEEAPVRPGSSYGMQKAVGELLVCDYSRRGFVDGVVLRLPTVCVRPGRPNAAASSFVSSIIREPIRGEAATCPVSRDLELWLSSPRVAVANLLHGAFLAPGGIGAQGIVNLPGITVTVAEMIESLGRIAGRQASARISFREDPAASRIVSSWPARFDVARALSLGFRGDAGFDDLVRGFLDDEAAAASR